MLITHSNSSKSKNKNSEISTRKIQHISAAIKQNINVKYLPQQQRQQKEQSSKDEVISGQEKINNQRPNRLRINSSSSAFSTPANDRMTNLKENITASQNLRQLKAKGRDARIKSQYYNVNRENSDNSVANEDKNNSESENGNGSCDATSKQQLFLQFRRSTSKKIVFVKSLCHTKSDKSSLEKKYQTDKTCANKIHKGMSAHILKLNQHPQKKAKSKDMETNANQNSIHFIKSPSLNNSFDFSEKINNSHNSIRNKKSVVGFGLKYDTSQMIAPESSYQECKNISKTDLSKDFMRQSRTLKQKQSSRKENFSLKKRYSRVKITLKEAEKHKMSAEQQQNQNCEQDFRVFEDIKEQFKLNTKQKHNEVALNDQSSTFGISSTEKPGQNTLDDSKAIRHEQESLMKSSNITFESPGQFSSGVSNQNHRRNSSKFSKSHRMSDKKQQFCFNHPQKEAKFKLDSKNISLDPSNQTECFYCSKCTVLLVTQQGRTVIENLQVKPTRMQTLKNFLFEIDRFQPAIKQTLNMLQRLNDKIQQRYNTTERQIDEYYSQLIKALRTHQSSTIQGIRCYHEASQKKMKSLFQQIQECSQQVKFMRTDIIPNIDLIVDEEKLSMEIFSQIIQEHYAKLQKYETFIWGIHQQSFSYYDNNFLSNASNNTGLGFPFTYQAIQNVEALFRKGIKILENTQIEFCQKEINIIKQAQIKAQKQKNEREYSKYQHNSTIDHEKRSFSFEEYELSVSDALSSQKKKSNKKTSYNSFLLDNQASSTNRLSFGREIQNSNEKKNKREIKSPTFKVI